MLHNFKNSGIPFEKLINLIQPNRDLSRNPIFQVALNILNRPDQLNNNNKD
jgi:hypothetical protein